MVSIRTSNNFAVMLLHKSATFSRPKKKTRPNMQKLSHPLFYGAVSLTNTNQD